MKSPKELHAELEANTTLLKALMYERGQIKEQLEASLDVSVSHGDMGFEGSWDSAYIRQLCSDHLVYLKTAINSLSCKDIADYLGLSHAVSISMVNYCLKNKLLGE